MDDGAIILAPVAGEAQLSDPAITGPFAPEMAVLAMVEQVEPWCGYLARRDGQPLGLGGVKAPPDKDGAVEIGYLTFPKYEGTGVAKALTAAMIGIAKTNGALSVIAHTLCAKNASTAVLFASGFARNGDDIDPNESVVWRWRLTL